MKKNLKQAALGVTLIGVLGIGGIVAYFTDADTATNTFTVGKVQIDLQEPNWKPVTDITPNQEIVKDPQIKNDGVNDAYVFLTVDVPYENIVTANDDGTKNTAADTELFGYSVNSGWIELGTPQKSAEEGVVKHTYVYGTETECMALAKDQNTDALFDSMTFCNAVEDQNLETSAQQVVINAYAIQTTDINGGKTAPADVWEVLKNQGPTTVVSVEEDAVTDIKK